MKIWFDMDGTIADLYGVNDWLPAILARDTRPYEIARGIGNLALIARLLNKAQKNGHEIGIISWTAKNAPADYNARVATAKREWLARHLKSVEWNEIKVVEYGTNKYMACGGGILFDDEKPNRETWGAGAHEPAEIVEVLKALTRQDNGKSGQSFSFFSLQYFSVLKWRWPAYSQLYVQLKNRVSRRGSGSSFASLPLTI